jgi:hypothetical protein
MSSVLQAHGLGKRYGRRDALWGEHADRQSTFIVRCRTDLPAGDWTAEHLDLEDLVLSYLEGAARPGAAVHTAARTAGDNR